MMKKRDPPNKSLLKIAVFTLQQKCQCNQLLDLTSIRTTMDGGELVWLLFNFCLQKKCKKITIKKQDASTES
jgi:hypothetical protein